ncbi:DUF202 domain-containing protein [Streptomyces oceani]|uniref:DUF202 domain-containing protein n=1 Tax=Streptomyces oceani TaxID=1075402 RepID=A0A1E7KH88_9ACTN|nr:DUF202 domain-containing protein [Streptomyces oceani]OEV03204.1 hypothetical protein AN216_12735 [Streptomyces oceani]
MTAGRDGEADGAQRERTRLSWRRTTLAYTVVTALAVRTALVDGNTPPARMAAALTALAWLGFLVVAHRRIHALTTAGGGVGGPVGAAAGRFVTGAVLCALVMAVLGAVLLW